MEKFMKPVFVGKMLLTISKSYIKKFGKQKRKILTSLQSDERVQGTVAGTVIHVLQLRTALRTVPLTRDKLDLQIGKLASDLDG